MVDIEPTIELRRALRAAADPTKAAARQRYFRGTAEYHEELILAFALVRKVVKRYPGDDLLDTFER